MHLLLPLQVNALFIQLILCSAQYQMVEQHHHNAHSANPNDPTFVKNGKYNCDPEITKLCSNFATTVLQGRIDLGNPGPIQVHGTDVHVFFNNLFDVTYYKTVTLSCTVRSTDANAPPPRTFTMSLLSSLRYPPTHGPATVYFDAHPSQAAYGRNNTIAIRSIAQQQDRIAEECHRLHGLAKTAGSHRYYSRLANAIASASSRDDQGSSWGKIVYWLRGKERQERARRLGLGEDWRGYSNEELEEMVGAGLARSYERAEQRWMEREDEFRNRFDFLPTLGEGVPDTRLERLGCWLLCQLIVQRTVALPLNLQSPAFVEPSRDGYPLSLPADYIYSRTILSERQLAYPLPSLASPAFLEPSCLGYPLSIPGVAVNQHASVAAINMAHPLPSLASPAFVEPARSGYPLAQLATYHTEAQAHRNCAIPLPSLSSPAFIEPSRHGYPLSKPAAMDIKETVIDNRTVARPLGRLSRTADGRNWQEGAFVEPSREGYPLARPYSQEFIPQAEKKRKRQA